MSVPDHIPDVDLNEFEPSPDVLTRRAKYLHSTIDRFWQRWRKEYLVELRESHRQCGTNSKAPQVSVGDVVIIHSDDQPRGMWSLGLVESCSLETMVKPGELFWKGKKGQALAPTSSEALSIRDAVPEQKFHH